MSEEKEEKVEGQSGWETISCAILPVPNLVTHWLLLFAWSQTKYWPRHFGTAIADGTPLLMLWFNDAYTVTFAAKTALSICSFRLFIWCCQSVTFLWSLYHLSIIFSVHFSKWESHWETHYFDTVFALASHCHSVILVQHHCLRHWYRTYYEWQKIESVCASLIVSLWLHN